MKSVVGKTLIRSVVKKTNRLKKQNPEVCFRRDNRGLLYKDTNLFYFKNKHKKKKKKKNDKQYFNKSLVNLI